MFLLTELHKHAHLIAKGAQLQHFLMFYERKTNVSGRLIPISMCLSLSNVEKQQENVAPYCK